MSSSASRGITPSRQRDAVVVGATDRQGTEDRLDRLRPILHEDGLVPSPAGHSCRPIPGIGLQELPEQHRPDLVHGGSDGHLGGLQVPWGLLSAHDPADQAVDFPGNLRLDEREEVFFPSERALASSGSGRAAQIASLTAISLSLRARNSL